MLSRLSVIKEEELPSTSRHQSRNVQAQNTTTVAGHSPADSIELAPSSTHHQNTFNFTDISPKDIAHLKNRSSVFAKELRANNSASAKADGEIAFYQAIAVPPRSGNVAKVAHNGSEPIAIIPLIHKRSNDRAPSLQHLWLSQQLAGKNARCITEALRAFVQDNSAIQEIQATVHAKDEDAKNVLKNIGFQEKDSEKNIICFCWPRNAVQLSIPRLMLEA